MFEKTDTKFAPWLVIKANKKMRARVEVIQKLLEIVPYASDDSNK
jgi:polyphosphate kinase 2 (PPK2 family)